MPISWMSRQGQRTRTNNDAAAVGHRDHYLLAMLVDAAEQGSNGQGLAQHWAQSIVRAALSGHQPPDITSITQLMREQQRELRHHYLHEIASYCCVLIDLQSRQLHILHAGDCLVGTHQANGRIDWLTTPHTLSNQPSYAQLPPATEAAAQRHLLTRSLNARRFCAPDSYATVLEPAASLLLCTDGYWYEHLKQGVDLQQLHDDASALSLTLSEPTNRQQTDCDNFFIIAPSPADSLARSRLESQLESRLESELAARVVMLLRQQPLGKAALAEQLGHKTVSAELHKQIKRLLALAVIEMTLPDKPSSRLQKYRLLDASLTKDDA